MSLEPGIFTDSGHHSVGCSFNGAADALVSAPRVGLGAYVERVQSALRADERWSTAAQRIVVGHSFGGMLALALGAAEGAPPPTGLVLAATTAGPMYQVLRPVLVRAGSFECRVPARAFMRIWSSAPVLFSLKLATTGSLSRRPVDFERLRTASDLAIGLAGWRNTDWRAMRSYRLAMDGLDLRRQARRLTIPAIVLHGTRDSLFPLSVAEELAGLLPQGELRLVPGAGHALPLTHSVAVAEAVRDLTGRA